MEELWHAQDQCGMGWGRCGQTTLAVVLEALDSLPVGPDIVTHSDWQRGRS